MQVSKPLATFGFHFCVTIFVGLSIYGIIRYLNEGLKQSDSLLAAALYAAFILASITGIGFFGMQADRRRQEEARNSPPPNPVRPKKKKS
jgi:hypothetical protein